MSCAVTNDGTKPAASGHVSKKLAVFAVISAFGTLSFPVGAIKSSGVLFYEFQNHLGANAVEASAVGSILYGAYFLCGPIATVLCNRLGYRFTFITGALLATLGIFLSAIVTSIYALYLTFGVMLGMGSSFLNTCTFAFVGQLFTKKRPFVNNIICIGSSVVSIPLSILLQVWLDNYGWMWTMLLLGAVVLNALPFGLFLTHVIHELPDDVGHGLKLMGKKRSIDTSLLRQRSFVAYMVSCGCHMSSMVLISIYLIRYGQSLGIDSTTAASLQSTMSFIDISLRPIIGYFLSLETVCGRPVSRSLFLAIFLLLQAVTAFLIPTFSIDYGTVLAFSIFYATVVGFAGSLPVTVLADLFGADKLASSLGIRYFVIGFFSLVVPPLASLCVDQLPITTAENDLYRMPFYFSAGFAFVSFSLLMLTRFLVKRARRREPPPPQAA